MMNLKCKINCGLWRLNLQHPHFTCKSRGIFFMCILQNVHYLWNGLFKQTMTEWERKIETRYLEQKHLDAFHHIQHRMLNSFGPKTDLYGSLFESTLTGILKRADNSANVNESLDMTQTVTFLSYLGYKVISHANKLAKPQKMQKLKTLLTDSHSLTR